MFRSCHLKRKKISQKYGFTLRWNDKLCGKIFEKIWFENKYCPCWYPIFCLLWLCHECEILKWEWGTFLAEPRNGRNWLWSYGTCKAWSDFKVQIYLISKFLNVIITIISNGFWKTILYLLWKTKLYFFSLLSVVIDRAIKIHDLASTAAMLVLQKLGIDGGTSSGTNFVACLHIAAA